jgi:hypothetical protein
MNENTWRMLVSAIASLPDAPSWLGDFANLSREQAMNLSELGNESAGDSLRQLSQKNRWPPL